MTIKGSNHLRCLAFWLLIGLIDSTDKGFYIVCHHIMALLTLFNTILLSFFSYRTLSFNPAPCCHVQNKLLLILLIEMESHVSGTPFYMIWVKTIDFTTYILPIAKQYGQKTSGIGLGSTDPNQRCYQKLDCEGQGQGRDCRGQGQGQGRDCRSQGQGLDAEAKDKAKAMTSVLEDPQGQGLVLEDTSLILTIQDHTVFRAKATVCE